jgi:nitrate/nitrite transport system substrate-binding protein
MKEIDPELQRQQPPHPITADALKPIVEEFKQAGEPLRMGMVFPVSTHNYELRYWLAAAGIRPGFYSNGDTTGTTDAEVLLSVTPPPQMPATLEQGTIQGYCVGEPWNQKAVMMGIGVPIITNYDIWKNNPEKVFGVTAEWNRKHPNTHTAAVKALIRAGKWLDASRENRRQAVQILAQGAYVGADPEVIASSMTGTFEFEKGDVRDYPDFNVFYRYDATYPFYSHCIWFLTQMRRWGQIPEPKPDEWYLQVAKEVYHPEIWRRAARELVDDGILTEDELPATDGFKPPDDGFIDHIVFDAHQPNEYLSKFTIGLKN